MSIAIALAPLAAASRTDGARLLRIGTGGQTGVYYPIGRIIARGLTGVAPGSSEGPPGGVPGYIGVAQKSAGSIENVNGVVSGQIEAGIVQADVAHWASRAEQVFRGDDKARAVRAVAGLYREKFQIVTRRDAGIRSVPELRGKRISIDEMGSGTLAVMRIVLAAHGMNERDLQPVYLKPVFTSGKIISGELQGFVMMAGAPMEAASRLSGVGLSLVPIGPEIAARISKRHPYLSPSRIAAGTYPGIGDVPTIGVYALLVVHADMDEALVYRITAALWSRRTLSMLEAGHPQGGSITPGTALTGVSIPLHPGAESYYHEHPQRFGTPVREQ